MTLLGLLKTTIVTQRSLASGVNHFDAEKPITLRIESKRAQHPTPLMCYRSEGLMSGFAGLLKTTLATYRSLATALVRTL